MAKRAKNLLSEKTAPNPFLFHDYRTFLKALVSHKKASDSNFSLRRLAQRCGVTVSFLSMVTNQQRTLNTDKFTEVCDALGVSETHRAYLNLLRTIGDSNSEEERLEAMERLTQLKSYRDTNPAVAESYRYLTHWYFVAIREMAMLPGFEPTAPWIQRNLRINLPREEIQKAVDFLTGNGFLKPNGEGRYTQADKDIDCTGGLYRIAIVNFHREMLALLDRALVELPPQERYIVSHSVALGQAEYDKVIEILTKAQKEIEQVGRECQATEKVYHIALATFPLTRSGGKP